MEELIRKLTECYGPSGSEGRVRELIADEVRPFVDEVKTDPIGNLHAMRNGQGPKLMLAAHLDEIGIIVTHIDDKGFLRFGAVGGANPITLPGHRVIFANGTVGVIGWEKRESAREEVKLSKLYLDIGARDKETATREGGINVGDTAVFAGSFAVLRQSKGQSQETANEGDRYLAKALDDRIGCAVLVEVIKRTRDFERNLACVFTVQEEIGARGAITSSFSSEPDLAIAVDVTATGDTPEATHMAVSLGHGPAIKIKDRGMMTSPKIKDLLLNTARRLNLPYQLEVLEFGTTDAAMIQISRAGVATGTVSIPCRYVHTVGEMVDQSDVENAVKLLVGVMEGLGAWHANNQV